MIDIVEATQTFYLGMGTSESLAGPLASLTLVLAIALLALAADYVAKRIVLGVIRKYVVATRTQWDDVLLHNKFFDRLVHIVPAAMIYYLFPLIFNESHILTVFVQRLCSAFILVTIAMAVSSLLNSVAEIYQELDVSRRKPIVAYLQIAKILFYLVIAIFVIATLIDRSPWALLSGLGAMTAILLLVFKDTILGFVAGVQLSSQDMVRVGDWIEMPKYGVDGDVMSITVNTVKVRNFDKTITTIPTYSLITDSFKNWRGMSDTGARRIKRSINLDINSVRFCDSELLERLSRIQILTGYIEAKKAELDNYNLNNRIDDSEIVNGRRMTNLGTFRAYVIEYLRNHPTISGDFTLLVRQLAPGTTGIPIEIYCFSSDPDWINYETIQSDIFDHLLSVVGEFDLRVFQEPSGMDYRDLLSNLADRTH